MARILPLKLNFAPRCLSSMLIAWMLIATLRVDAAAQSAAQMLVQLDARDASAASGSWKNTAPHPAGDFARIGSPQLTKIGDQPAVQFSGRGDVYRGPMAPPTLCGAHPRTIEVWVNVQGRLGGEGTLVAWGSRGQPRENMAFNYGTAQGSGALTTWAGDMGWGVVPPANAWHHLVFVFDGAVAAVYDNTTLRNTHDFPDAEALETAAGFPILIGAQNDGSPTPRANLLAGNIALLRIYDAARTLDQIKTDYQQDAARFGAVAPAPAANMRGPAAQPTPSFPEKGGGIPATGVKKLDDGLLLTMTPGMMRLQVWSPRIVRVTYAREAQLPEIKSLSVIGKPEKTEWKTTAGPEATILETSAMKVRVDNKTGSVSFLDLKDHPILSEAAGGKLFAPTTVTEVGGTAVRDTFALDPEEGIYGLGQHQRGTWDYRGTNVHLQQRNMDIGLPVLVSSKGYGVLWDNPAVTDIAVGMPGHEKELSWTSEVGKVIDYYFMFGPTADGVIQDYRKLTGDAPMMGEWAFGFWQCKERYQSQQELIDVVTQYRQRGVPIDGIIQDWQYWPNGRWGSHEFDATRYPDPAALVKTLHDDLHVHMLISVWSKFDLDTPNYNELNAAGAFYDPIIPYVSPPGRGKWFDPFNAKGREIFWNQISKELFSLGIDGWWLDATEPELGGRWGEFRTFKTADGPGATVFNAYPLEVTSGIYTGQRAATDAKRVMILTRSAYAGNQRNAAVSWSGDITGNWQTLKRQVPAGLNFSISGIPYWNTDIGGFFGGNPRNRGYQELFTRWFEYGAFTPMFRVHGTNSPKELWRWPDATQKIWETYVKLRYRLMPYIYSTSWQVTHEGGTMMRPLVMDFAGDKKAQEIGDQYMFGPALMVSPVTDAGATTRTVYLPPSGPQTQSAWYDFWTGKQQVAISGAGLAITAAAPIETMPIHVRAGSIVPMMPLMQYAGEKPVDPLEVRVYRGADGAFTLYEDEGDTYHYEKGTCATIPFTWNESTKTLTIGKRQGEFPGMLKERTIHVVFVSDGHGAGPDAEANPDRVVKYEGSEMVVN